MATDLPPAVLSPLSQLTIDEASKALQQGRISSEDLVKAYLARIEEAAAFNAVLQVNPDVIAAAKALDNERAKSGSRSSLHGIPILVKDNIVTKDNLHASGGSYVLLGAKPSEESSVVAKLRAAGALVLGKTNLGEWGNFRGRAVPNGWSPRGGQTLSSYFKGGDSGGSSSGSAVATSLGLCTAALGSETAGSITFPAEMNNVVGLKPSRGLIGTDGVIPISGRQDVMGPLARTVKDAAHMLSIMAGRSERDQRTWNIPFSQIPDYTTFCNSTDLSGMAIGVPRNAMVDDLQPAVLKAFNNALQLMQSAGAKVVEDTNLSAAAEYAKLSDDTKNTLRSAEFKQDIISYLKTLTSNPNKIKSLDDIIQFTQSHPEEQYPAIDMDNFLWTQSEKTAVADSEYEQITRLEQRLGGEDGVLGVLEKHNLDVLVVPSWLGLANDVAARLGLPVMAVPLGFWPDDTAVLRGSGDLIWRAPGIPFCLTFITKAYAEDKLFRIAYAYEQLSAVRRNGPSPVPGPQTELV